MQHAFGTVIWVVVIVAAVLAVVALLLSRRTWAEHGRSGLVMDHDLPPDRAAGVAAAPGEREQEIRELMAARNARRARRGEAPLELDAELARLSGPAPTVDPELAEEIRQLVVARNHRRVRAGKPPLDIEAELARELRKLDPGLR